MMSNEPQPQTKAEQPVCTCCHQEFEENDGVYSCDCEAVLHTGHCTDLHKRANPEHREMSL